MDGKSFIYTPLWVRILAISALLVVLALSMFVTWTSLEDENEGWVLVAMSVVQVSTSGLVLTLLVFFSARDVGSIGLRGRTDALLLQTIPRSLLFIDFPVAEKTDWNLMKVGSRRILQNLKKSPTKIKIQHNSGENSAIFTIGAFGESCTLGIQVNVWELTVSYYFPAESDSEIAELKERLEWAISRYVDIVGYKESWYFSTEAFDGRTYVSVHLTKNFDKEFLDDERQKLQFSQDIASSTRSLLKDCIQKKILTSY